MFYIGHLCKIDIFQEPANLQSKPSKKTSTQRTPTQRALCIADTFSRTRHKFYQYMAKTKQQFRSFSREKVLVMKKICIFSFHTSIHSIVYIVFNFLNLHIHLTHHPFVSKQPVFHRNLQSIVITTIHSFTSYCCRYTTT